MPNIATDPAMSGGALVRDSDTQNELSRQEHDALQKLVTNYPSQSLRFLHDVPSQSSGEEVIGGQFRSPPLASCRLSIIIVGAGLGGLAAAIALARKGHSVRVLEQAQQLGEVGAGIQIPPNSGRLLHRWGVFEHLQKHVVAPQSIHLRRWENGKIIGCTDLGDQFKSDFEVPYYVVHRAHLHEALHVRATELGVVIELSSKVAKYDERGGSVELVDGFVVRGDLIVAADGIKSAAREAIQPRADHEPTFTGFAAYRATVDVKKMQADVEMALILERPSINLWIGEDKHVMTYAMNSGEKFNLVLSHVDHTHPNTWTEKLAKDHIQAEFAGWDPLLTKILSLIDSSLKWPLRVGQKLSRWTSPSSKLVIIGDGAHAMLPYMSQGAAMAVEDGAALAIALNHISSLDEMPFALRVFEKERIKRSGAMMDASSINGLIWHFPDGPEQRARDASMAAEVAGLPFTHSANQWSDPVTYWWAYGYDAEEAMEQAWRRTSNDATC